MAETDMIDLGLLGEFHDALRQGMNDGSVAVAGAVYDISTSHLDGNNQPTAYANLAAALGNNGENVPQNVRKGGMSIKFIQSSDNKYVQYFLTKDEWSTAVSDWQMINDNSIGKRIELIGKGSTYITDSAIITGFIIGRKYRAYIYNWDSTQTGAGISQSVLVIRGYNGTSYVEYVSIKGASTDIPSYIDFIATTDNVSLQGKINDGVLAYIYFEDITVESQLSTAITANSEEITNILGRLSMIGEGNTYITSDVFIRKLIIGHTYRAYIINWLTDSTGASSSQGVLSIYGVNGTSTINYFEIKGASSEKPEFVDFVATTDNVSIRGRLNSGVTGTIAFEDITSIKTSFDKFSEDIINPITDEIRITESNIDTIEKNISTISLAGKGSTYISSDSFFNLIIGCKYRAHITNWLVNSTGAGIAQSVLQIYGIDSNNEIHNYIQFNGADAEIPEYIDFTAATNNVSVRGRLNNGVTGNVNFEFAEDIIKIEEDIDTIEDKIYNEIDLNILGTGVIISDTSLKQAFEASLLFGEDGNYKAVFYQSNAIEENFYAPRYLATGNVCNLYDNQVSSVLNIDYTNNGKTIVSMIQGIIINDGTDDLIRIGGTLSENSVAEKLMFTYNIDSGAIEENYLVYDNKRVLYTLVNFNNMLYEKGIVTDTDVSADFPPQPIIPYKYNGRLYVLESHLSSGHRLAGTQTAITLLSSSDGIDWEYVIALPTLKADEMSICIKDGIVHAVVRGIGSTIKYIAFDMETGQILKQTEIENSIRSRPSMFTYNNEIYFAVNVIPSVYEFEYYDPSTMETEGNTSSFARLQVAFYKVNESDYSIKRIKQITSPDGVLYYDIRSLGLNNDDNFDGRESVYMIYSEDRRKINPRRMFSDIAMVNITPLLGGSYKSI